MKQHKGLSKGRSKQDNLKRTNTPSKNNRPTSKPETQVSESTEKIIRNTTIKYQKAIRELANR